MEGDGVAGDRRLKDNEEGIKAFDKVIQVDQLRNANKLEGRMAEQKSVVRFRETSRDQLAYWLADRCDQLAFLTLSGVDYGTKNNGATRTGSDLINLTFNDDVEGPTSARALRWNGTSKVLSTSGATSQVEAADTPTYNMIVQLKAYAKNSYIRGLRSEGGDEKYNMFVSPLAMAKLKLDPDFLANVRFAARRGEGNALFTGEVVDMDGVSIYEYRHVFNTSGTSTKWGATNTVDGCQILFCGAQALAMADIGTPTWVEEGDDYENQHAIAVGKIFGFLKPQFYTQYGSAPQTTQDLSVISVYVAQ
jgi:N4-gp56 family major capsid protein